MHPTRTPLLAQLLHARRTDVLRVAAAYGGRNVRLFGSVARGQDTPTSDVDLLVTLDAGRTLLDLIAIQQDLEDLLGCSVDVVTEESISPYLRERILQEAVPL